MVIPSAHKKSGRHLELVSPALIVSTWLPLRLSSSKDRKERSTLLLYERRNALSNERRSPCVVARSKDRKDHSKLVLVLGSKQELVLALGSKQVLELALGSKQVLGQVLGSRQVLAQGRQAQVLGSKLVLAPGSKLVRSSQTSS
ncbi:hypothetical protein [Rhodopirellula sallentina]|uniref:hypothetical protein n=1 Tax=Rhodopirellula sallentina TaxID=1263869 RepID=UPI001360B0E7|nr:hypothetical protein [Rhodopirellula sallentina]